MDFRIGDTKNTNLTLLGVKLGVFSTTNSL